MGKHKSQSQQREEVKNEEEKHADPHQDKKKRSESAKPPISYRPEDDKLGHLDIKNLGKRVTNGGKVYSKVAEMLESIIKIQEKIYKTEEKLSKNIDEFIYNNIDKNQNHDRTMIFEDVRTSMNRIIERKTQAARTHIKLTINGIGYLPTNMTAKYNLIKKGMDLRKKEKDPDKQKDYDKEHKRLIMELEWLRIKKLKMAYLIYLNRQMDSHHLALTNLAKMYSKLQKIE